MSTATISTRAISNKDLSALTTMKLSHSESSWRCNSKLWSSIQEVCDLLSISAPAHIEDDSLFQHVRYKAGQRIHTIGQSFESLFIVNSGFLKTVLIDEYGNEQVLSFPMNRLSKD